RFVDDLLQDFTRRELVQVDRGLHHAFEPGVAFLDHLFVRGVTIRRLVFDDVQARGLRIAYYQIQLQRQVDIGDVVTHAGSDEDPGSLGEVDDVELHGAAGAEPPGGDNVDLVGRWFAGHPEVRLSKSISFTSVIRVCYQRWVWTAMPNSHSTLLACGRIWTNTLAVSWPPAKPWNWVMAASRGSVEPAACHALR